MSVGRYPFFRGVLAEFCWSHKEDFLALGLVWSGNQRREKGICVLAGGL